MAEDQNAKVEVKPEKGQGAGASEKPKAKKKGYIPTYFGNKRFTIRYKSKTWMVIVGVIIAVACFISVVEEIYHIATGNPAFDISSLTSSVIGIIGGIVLLIYGNNYNRKYGRYAQLINCMMGKIPVQNIAYEYPVPYDTALKDLQKMIDNKILYGAFLDYRNGMLVLNQNNPNEEELIPAARGMAGAASAGNRDAERAKGEGAKDSGNMFSRKNWIDLARTAEEIKDQDIKLRASRISSTLESIREKGEQEKKLQDDEQLKRFVGFYVPKIVDLLGQYERLEKVEGLEKKDELKRDLVDTLDSLDHATMNLWNEIVSSDVINISTELDALNKKLVIDGLGDSDFTVEGGKDGK